MKTRYPPIFVSTHDMYWENIHFFTHCVLARVSPVCFGRKYTSLKAEPATRTTHRNPLPPHIQVWYKEHRTTVHAVEPILPAHPTEGGIIPQNARGATYAHGTELRPTKQPSDRPSILFVLL